MTAQIALIGSHCSGFCTGHTGGHRAWAGVITSSPGSFVTAGGTRLALIGATGVADCGHTFTVLTGSTVAKAEGIGLALVGSSCPTSPGGSTGIITTGYAYGTA